MAIHVVRSGDTVYNIASRYGVSPDTIINSNELTNPASLVVGQTIVIPAEQEKLGTIEVNGFAFPDINQETLRKTLPNLTYLSIFSYNARRDGSLSAINDTPLINQAIAAGVAPLMVVTNIEESSGFNSDIAHEVLTQEDPQTNLINNIVRILDEKNYFGINIDFEYIYPYDRQSYNFFLQRLTDTLEPLGYLTSTSIAPKISATQPGLLYEAHDYPVHGREVNRVILMTYEWGYTYGPPMAVAPLNEVRRVLNYAVTAIPREKILMGIPNYGYDWTLPYVRGSSATPVSNTGAVNLARQNNAAIQYDLTAQSPFFNYYDENRNQHIVWFEDARSIEAKLRLVNEFNLAGVSYWTIGRYFPQNWLILNSLYNVRKVL